MKDTFSISMKYKTTVLLNVRRAFGHMADKHPLGTSSKYVEGFEDASGKRRQPGVYRFAKGGRKFDGREKFVSDDKRSRDANELFRKVDKQLKKLDKRYHRIYGHGRFDDVEMEVTVNPDGTIDVSALELMSKLAELLSDDHGEEESIRNDLMTLMRLLVRT